MEHFGVKEISERKFSAFTIGIQVEGGINTTITQTNDALVLFRGGSGGDGYIYVDAFDSTAYGKVQALQNGVVHKRTVNYGGLFRTPTDFSMLIAEGVPSKKITLDIAPSSTDTGRYTIEIDYSKVTFTAEPAPAVTDAAVKPVLPNPSSYSGSNPTGLSVDSVTKGANTGIYTVALKSEDPIGVKNTTVGNYPSSEIYNDFVVGTYWNTELLTESNGANLATLALNLTGYTSGAITIRQENPGFALYEAYVSDPDQWTWQPDTHTYSSDPYFVWSGPADKGGRILYKEKTYATEAAYGKTSFGGLDFLLWGGLPDEEVDKVVTFIITYTNGSGDTVTKIIKVDYSDVEF
jgi:hypothetical protein